MNSTAESLKAGCDIEFPFSTKWRFDKLAEALRQGRIAQEDIDKAAENALVLVERVKGDDMSEEPPEREDDREETRQLIRNAGVEGLTLLKNQGAVLPISRMAKVAVIGPNANRPITGGGGSASLNPYYNTLPLESIRKIAEQEVAYAVGCHINKWLPVASPLCTTRDGTQGVTIQWFIGDRFEGTPAVVQQRPNTDLFLWDSAPLSEVGAEWSAIVTTCLTPASTGQHTISFMSVGPGRLYVNGALALDLWDWTEEGEAMFDGSVDYLVQVAMEAGKSTELKVEMTNELRPISKQQEMGTTHRYGGCRIGFKEQDKIDYLGEAVDAARAADVAVVVVGLDAEWESEGYDRQNMDLPGSQDKLVEAVVRANPRTVVVNQSGSPVTMPWADEVPAIIQAWYQGQEAGNALADVLFGLRSPSGKLPVRFPYIAEIPASRPPLTDPSPVHVSQAPRRRTSLPQLAGREPGGGLRRGPVHRVPTLRPSQDRAAVPLWPRPLVRGIRVRAADAQRPGAAALSQRLHRADRCRHQHRRHRRRRDGTGVRQRRALAPATAREGAGCL